ncbi:MAG: magnesium/cobalt transporter CorA [Snowella sp.]|nr:magnesium/cobalt transporter CorA [Snowella sp.]
MTSPLTRSPDLVEEEQDLFDYYYHEPGSAPGTLGIEPDADPTEIELIDYNAHQIHFYRGLTPQECVPFLDTESVSWINIQGLGSENVLREIGEIFKLPPLILEDIVNVPQRPKLEYYENFLIITTQMVMIKKQGFWMEQVSFILGKSYLLTIQEEPERDPFDPVRQRLEKNIGFIRQLGPDYLCYALADAIVDNFFPVLENYGDRLEDLEEEAITSPNQKTLTKIYQIRRELLALRRLMWPQREIFNSLIRDGSDYIHANLLNYFRDCYDHTVQIIDVIETYRELAAGLTDVYLSATGNRMNEIMKVLTIISTIFIPLTFIAGIYGMNFNTEKSPFNMPELNWYWGYVACWAVMILITSVQIYIFWKRGWFRQGVFTHRDR